MAEGNRLLTIREMIPDPMGDGPPTPGRSVKAWATLRYGSATQTLDQAVVISERKAVWTIRQIAARWVSPTCELTDDTGTAWKIEAVTEPPGQRGVWFSLHCEAVT